MIRLKECRTVSILLNLIDLKVFITKIQKSSLLLQLHRLNSYKIVFLTKSKNYVQQLFVKISLLYNFIESNNK